MEKNNANYSADQIQVLEGLEAVRVRPGMYIGSTSQRGLHHLVYEIVDNSVDEALAGYCTEIIVEIKEDNIIMVSDNGRGIPVDKHKKTGLSAAETVYTVLHAGGKFGGDSGYKVSGGLHGVGASVVNALSEWTEVEIKRNNKLYKMKFEKGKTVETLKEVGTSTTTGTMVTFKADSEIFETTEYDFDVLAKRLREMAFLNKGLKITFTDSRNPERIEKQEYHYEGGLVSFVEYLNRNKDKLHETPAYFSKEDGEVPVEVAFQFTKSYSENVLGFANNINTPEGGTHIEGFRRAFTKTINDYARNKGLLKEKEENFIGEDIREGITAIISVKVTNPQYEGQTKTKLGNSEAVGAVLTVVNEQLVWYLEENPNVAKIIIEKCKASQRARNAAKRAREMARKSVLSEGITLPGKLADCIEKDYKKCELYIVEGDSAGGTAKQGRDRNFQAILPLWGKMLNVEKTKEDKVYSNQKLNPLIQCIGAGMGNNFNLEKIRYGKVIIMADADVDGAHIRTLLLTFFYRHMKPLIEAGHVFLAQPPLYKLSKRGMEDIYCYSDKELEDRMKEFGPEKDSVRLQRYKGLGEMNKEQLWETTMDPEHRTLIKVTVEDAAYEDEIFTTLMGDNVQPRKEFIEKYAHTVKNLDI